LAKTPDILTQVLHGFPQLLQTNFSIYIYIILKWFLKKCGGWGKLKERDKLQESGTDRRIILKWFLKKYGGWGKLKERDKLQESGTDGRIILK
jgi:hypothetical protein